MASLATFRHGPFLLLYHLPEHILCNDKLNSNVNYDPVYFSLLLPSIHPVLVPQIYFTVSDTL